MLMSINPDNYLLALILWHLIFCSVLTLQASLQKGLWILAGSGPPQQTRLPSNVSELTFEAGSQEKTASRKPLSKGTGEMRKWPMNNCEIDQAFLCNRHANDLLLAITLLSQTTSEQRARRRRMFLMCLILKRIWGSRHSVPSAKPRAWEHMKSLLHTDYFSITVPRPFSKCMLGSRFFPSALGTEC